MTLQEVENQFKDFINDKNLSHAYLIESENQDSLNLISNKISKIIFCQNKNGCGECKNCKLIDSNEFYQLISIGDGVSRIKKQEVLDLILNLNTSSVSDDQRKVYIIKNAEQLGNESGNSLLKTLEEPPNGVTAILLSQSRHEVLSTIRSRCKLFFIDDNFEPLIENELVDIIRSKKKEKLFLLSSKMSKMEKGNVLNLLKDTLEKIILKDYLVLASDFYDAIYNIKKANNFSLIIEDLTIKIFEVM